MDLKDKKVLVIGTGLSGIGSAELLVKKGAHVLLLEQNEKADRETIKKKFQETLTEEETASIEILIGDFPEEMIPELVIPSPAVPLDSPLLIRMKEAGVPVLSEIELGWRFEKGTVLAITGTNGKTTTTTLVGEIMKAAAAGKNAECSEESGSKNCSGDGGSGKCDDSTPKVFVVGNIGRSYAAAATETEQDSWTVGEISSFQLEAADTFRPHVSAILNITPDHLNRHYTMLNYAAIKERIAKNQTGEDFCILNYDDPYLRPFGEHLCPARVVWFSSKSTLPEGYYLDGDEIFFAERGKAARRLINVNETQLVGVCNAENVMAAIAMTSSAGVPMQTILSVVREFPPVPHRIEFSGEKRGVRYYNDSKATNPDAAIQGIRAMKGPTILIGGGYDKKNSYDDWIEAFDGKVKKLVLIGQTREDIAACARKHGFDQIIMCETFQECLETCTSLAEPGDEVLLSPACASWGMFPNYEVRGDQFKEYVRNL